MTLETLELFIYLALGLLTIACMALVVWWLDTRRTRTRQRNDAVLGDTFQPNLGTRFPTITRSNLDGGQ